MTGDDRILETLNDVLTAELTAINQYFIDAKMCANWGLVRLAEKFHEESIGEMKDADELIERILYLDGVPNMQRLSPVRVGDSVNEKLTLALELETRRHRSSEHRHRARPSRSATTAPANCSRRSCTAKKNTPTGSKRSSA